MAVFVLSDCTVTVNTVVLSPYVKSVTLVAERDAVEVTAMSSGGASANAHKFIGGIQNNSATIEFMNDEDAAKTLLTLFAAVGSGTNVLILKNTAAGSTYTLTDCYLQSSQPVGGGAVGDLSTQSVTFTGGTLVKS